MARTARSARTAITPASAPVVVVDGVEVSPIVAKRLAREARTAQHAATVAAATNQEVAMSSTVKPARTRKPRVAKAPVPTAPAPTTGPACGCGCGIATIRPKARYLAGHDARHAAQVAASDADPAQVFGAGSRLALKVEGIRSTAARRVAEKAARQAAQAAAKVAAQAVLTDAGF